MELKSDILDELVELAAKHKLVPFLGAGCSINHLNYNWDDIRDDLGQNIGFMDDDHLKVVQKYVDIHGKDKLCEYLEDKLLIDDFDDDKGFSNLAVISLGLRVIYTTNQDNVMEKCFEKYGRTYSKIVELEDLGNSTPGDKLFFKFHGDLSKCDSVIFSADDYNKRIKDEDNFLNIRLRADLLAKNLLFIGYSLRDKNINLILKEIKTAFKDELPSAYMIAWEYTDELNKICEEHGITLIDPLKIFPEFKNNSEAFDRLLKELVEQTFMLKNKIESELLMSSTPITNRVVSKLEIDALDKIVDEKDFEESCEKFRAIMDQTVIPKDFEPDVVDIFKKLAIKCSSSSESTQLSYAGFHLLLSDINYRIKALSYLMITANVRENNSTFNPTIAGIKEKGYIIGIPDAVEFLINHEIQITDAFRVNIIRWVERGLDISHFPEDEQLFLKKWVDTALKGSTYKNPLDDKENLKRIRSRFRARTADEIEASLRARMPKSFNKPFEE